MAEIKWNPVPQKLEEERLKLFGPNSSSINGYVSEPYEIYAPKAMEATCKAIKNFEVRPDDIWIVTYPKTGTTMTQEMVWQIVNKVDTETAKKVSLFVRSPFLEVEGVFTPEQAEQYKEYLKDADPKTIESMLESVKFAANLDSPRIIKSHLPFEFLPKNLLDTCKVIFVCRNPKDTCVSYYHQYNNFPEYDFKGKFQDFAQMFLDGTVEMGSYWTMLKSAWKRKDHPNMKIIWFEEMKKDMMMVIRNVAKFIGYHMTELKVLQLDDHLYIDNFRNVMVESMNDESMKGFIRKGKVGDWKNYFNEETNKVWDKWIEENLKGTDIVLPKS